MAVDFYGASGEIVLFIPPGIQPLFRGIKIACVLAVRVYDIIAGELALVSPTIVLPELYCAMSARIQRIAMFLQRLQQLLFSAALLRLVIKHYRICTPWQLHHNNIRSHDTPPL